MQRAREQESYISASADFFNFQPATDADAVCAFTDFSFSDVACLFLFF